MFIEKDALNLLKIGHNFKGAWAKKLLKKISHNDEYWRCCHHRI